MNLKSYEDAGRIEARKLYPDPIFCEYETALGVCGKKAERHHKDGNTHNNDRSNVRFLCRKHHHEEDGRCQRESYRLANSEARKGRRNEASLANLRVGQRRGVPKSDEHRAAMSAGMRGKPKAKWSLERRAAFAAMKKAWYAEKRRERGLS